MPRAHKRKTSGSGSHKAKARRAKTAPIPPAALAPDPQRSSIVGIGASAGGLEALKAFFGAMPPKTGLVFVVVVHLDPTHESLMPELLSRITGLTVEQARDRQPLETDHVYVIPPNRTLTIDQGLIRVRQVADRRGLRGVIDHFLRSLAADVTGHGSEFSGGASRANGSQVGRSGRVIERREYPGGWDSKPVPTGCGRSASRGEIVAKILQFTPLLE